MALEGTIKDFGLPDIFQLIGLQRKTGILTLTSDTENITVTFENGMVVMADSSAKRLEDRIDRGDLLDVARQYERGTERLCQRLDAPAESLALVGERERRTVRRQPAGDAPGDRMVVGDPHDQPALALHELRHDA